MRRVPFFLPLSLFLVDAALACGGRTTEEDPREGDDTEAEGCSGPRPEAQAAPEGKSCTTNLDCDADHQCELVSGTGSYSCVNGYWVTSDMHWKVCRPGAEQNRCMTAPPSHDECTDNADCVEGECVEIEGCRPSSCECVESQVDGQPVYGWSCTDDCVRPRACR